jgi:tetratricopeptide (TPR) repeat protein
MQPLRQDLLRQALDYYRTFLDQRADDQPEALAAADRATRAFEKLLDTARASALLTAQLAESLACEAVALDRLGRTEEVLGRLAWAIRMHESLAPESPSRAASHATRLWSNRGAFESRLGRLDDAVRSYERGLVSARAAAPPEMTPLGFMLEQGDSGVVVFGVTTGSPADTGGIQVGDVLGSIAGSSIRTLGEIARVRTGLVAWVAVPAEVVRAGCRMELQLTPVRCGDFMTATTMYNLGYLLLERMHDPGRARPWLERAVDVLRRALLQRSSAAPDIR